MKQSLIYLKNINSIVCAFNLITYLVTGLDIFVAAACLNVIVLIILEFCIEQAGK